MPNREKVVKVQPFKKRKSLLPKAVPMVVMVDVADMSFSKGTSNFGLYIISNSINILQPNTVVMVDVNNPPVMMVKILLFQFH
jgi:hypothetical protein